MSAKSQSPLDSKKASEFIRKAVAKNKPKSEIVAGLAAKGIATSKDSIRRFCERNNVAASIAVAKSQPKPSSKKSPTKAKKQTSASMTKMAYSKIERDDEEIITVFVPGHPPKVADSSHYNYKRIVKAAQANDPTVIELFDVEAVIEKEFEQLSERITTKNGKVYVDGDPIDDVFTEHILRYLDEGNEDWKPLVAFFEKVWANPLSHSREQLTGWLKSNNFSITKNGDIIAYKGVEEAPEGSPGKWQSTTGGQATVDGVDYNGKIPNFIGAEVTMARSKVAHAPNKACNTGLHIGTHGYAQSYGSRGAVLEVHVNPRDVVSVPNGDVEKARVCRYKVVGIAPSSPYPTALVVS